MWSACGAAAAGPLGVERRALADAEAVLLVDDADREPGEARRRARSARGCRRRGRARRCASRSSVSRRRAAGVAPVSSANGIEPSTARAARRGSPRAARRASRSAPSSPPGGRPRARAASRRAATTVLPRADLAHQQALHRPPGGEVGVDLLERARAGRAVGSNGSEASQRSTSSPARLERDRRGGASVAGAAAHRERRLVQAELLEGEPVAGALRLVRRVREVGAAQRVGHGRRAGGGRGARPAAARSRRRARPSACQAHSRRRLRREPRGGVVDRDDPGRVQPGRPGPARPPATNSCVATRKPGAVELAVEQQPGPRAQALGEVGLVEPDRLHRPARRRRPPPRRGAGCAAGSGAPGPSARSTITVASSPIRRSATSRTPARSRWPCGTCQSRSRERLDPDRGRGRGELRARRPSSDGDRQLAAGSAAAAARSSTAPQRARGPVPAPVPIARGDAHLRPQARFRVRWDGSHDGSPSSGWSCRSRSRRRPGSSSRSTWSTSSGGLAYVSGHLPVDGAEVLMTGRVGGELDLEQGYEAARLTALSILASLQQRARRPRPGHELGQGARPGPVRARLRQAARR